MVSPGYWSLWGHTKSRSRRGSHGDAEQSVAQSMAKRGAHERAAAQPALAVRDDNKDHKNDGNKNKEKSSSTSSLETPSSSQEPTLSLQSITPTTSTSIAATTPAVVSIPTTTPSLTLTTSSSITPAATTVWLTTSELSTITSVQTTTAITALEATPPLSSLPALSTGIFRGQSDDSDDCDGCRKHHRPPPPNNIKFAIAFGTLGGVGFLVGTLWLAFFIYRWRKKQGQSKLGHDAYASNTDKPSRFNFKWPFGRSNSGNRGSTRYMNGPPGGPVYSNSSIMDEAMRSAYGSDSSSLRSVPHGYMDEKRQDANYALPMLDPTPIKQASLRESIANWFRRSNSNHPLRLNPNSRWSRSTSKSSATGLSMPTTAHSEDPYSASIYSAYASNAPPMPNLDSQRTYPVAAISPEPVELAAPVPAYIQRAPVADDAPAAAAPFSSPLTEINTGSRWSRSTSSGHERMSSASTWTDATQTTISGGRESIPAVPQGTGLSPPGFHRPGGSKDLGLTAPARETAELTALREELLDLYTQGARPASAVGKMK